MSMINMSYDIIYFAAAVTWIQLGGNEQLFAFSPREAGCSNTTGLNNVAVGYGASEQL
tara:strand:- start:58 stop:231 length:174 start_codon:yes stop_codon:yes gene_type:complete